MLIKKDLDNLRKELKEDLETAIAQIMGSLIKSVATKDDLKNLATKDDLKNVENRLTRVENDTKDIKRQLNDLKADLPTPQEFAGHEKRIAKLETTVFPL